MTKITTYGPGGFDPGRPDGNVIDEQTVEVPETPEQKADREFLAAVETATSVADLKAALLGTGSAGRAAARPT